MKSLLLVFTLIFSAVAVSANDVASGKGISEQTLSAITVNLSKKLQADLSDNTAKVKINDIEKLRSTKTLVDFKGTALCVLESENNQLPIRFEVKINPKTQSVSDITYSFVEEDSEFVPSTTEEILMRELMKQVSADYKTESVVIAIDGFEIVQTGDRKEYKGNGEIKIGEVEWSKISFDVILDSENKPAKIKYNVK